MRSFRIFTWALSALTLLATQSGADILAEYTFTGPTGANFNRASTDGNAHTSASHLTDGRANFALGPSVGNPGPSYAVIADRMARNEADTIAANNYATFTVIAEGGHTLNLTELRFELMDSAPDVFSTWAIRSDVDGFQTTLGSFNGAYSASDAFTPYSLDLSAPEFQGRTRIEFRLYPYCVRSTSGASARMDNLRLEGDLSVDYTLEGDYRSGPEIEIAPITPEFPRHSGGSLVELPDGTLLYAWNRFYVDPDHPSSGGDDDPAIIVLIRSTDRGVTWSEPMVLDVPTGAMNNIQCSFLQIGNTTQLYYSKRESISNADKWLVESTDGGHTWSEPRQVTDGTRRYTGPAHRALRLSSGRILLPCHTDAWTPGGMMETVPIVVRSDDGGLTWNTSDPVFAEAKAYQNLPSFRLAEPVLVERLDGSVLMYARTHVNRFYESVSTDGGETWSEATPTAIQTLTAPPQIMRLSDGRLALFWNPITDETREYLDQGLQPPRLQKRTFLAMATSEDDGFTWSDPNILLDGGNDHAYAYPAGLEVDGHLLIMVSKPPEIINPASIVQIKVLLNQELPRAANGTPLHWLQSQFGEVEDWDAAELLEPAGNGQPVWVAYQAGLDPFDPKAIFQIVETTPAATGWTLRWRGSDATGVTTPFRIETSTTLAPDDWHFRAEVERTSEAVQEWTDPEAPDAPKRFYRVVAP